MVEFARLGANAFKTVEAAAVFACKQRCQKAAIGEEVERLYVELDSRCVSRHDTGNFFGQKNPDKVAIAGTIFDIYAAALDAMAAGLRDTSANVLPPVGLRLDGTASKGYELA